MGIEWQKDLNLFGFTTAEACSFETALKEKNENISMSGRIYGGLSREMVFDIFNEVMKLRSATGFGQRKISRIINQKFNVDFSENTIVGWLYFNKVPFANEKTQFKPRPKPFKEKLLNLYRKGHSITEVGNAFGVTFWTAKNWLKSYGIETRNHLESMNTNKMKNLLRKQKLLKPQKGLGEMSNEKAYIFGVLCGDGFISKKTVKLEIRHDKEFTQRFVDSVNMAYGTVFTYRYYPPRNSFITDISREVICQDLLDNNSFGTFTWRVPEEILNTDNHDYIVNFLQGYFDSEGHVGKYLVNVSSKNFEGLKQIQKLLSRLNIASNFYANNIILNISRKENLKKFKETVNFTIKRKSGKLASFYKGKW